MVREEYIKLKKEIGDYEFSVHTFFWGMIVAIVTLIINFFGDYLETWMIWTVVVLGLICVIVWFDSKKKLEKLRPELNKYKVKITKK